MLTTRKGQHRKENGVQRDEGILGAGEISENLWLRPPRISRRGERNILTRGRAIGKRTDARSTSDGNGTAEPSPGKLLRPSCAPPPGQHASKLRRVLSRICNNGGIPFSRKVAFTLRYFGVAWFARKSHTMLH